MEVVSINQGSDFLSEIPKPPVYLTDSAKVHYKHMAKELIKVKRLKEIHLPALESYASFRAIFEFACRKIREADQNEYGSGYFQTFKNGTVTQNSTWVNQMTAASKRLDEIFRQFGLDPASEKKLKSEIDPNQTSLFSRFEKSLNT